MTYRNDPYDPKQAALLDPAALAAAVRDARAAFAAAANPDELTALRHQYLGDRAPVSLARREIGTLPPAAKADAGKRVNEARREIEADFADRRAELDRAEAERVLVAERVDVTLPYDRRPPGARHPLTVLMDQMADLFVGMGYEIAEGPEVELEWANFDALNIPPDHPARGLMDTFHIAGRDGAADAGLVLRTHTSSVQVRTMLTRQPPIYIVCPGRVYRTDELDATHSPVFHQIEGLVVDRGITMAHLRGTLEHFARTMFGAAARVRWRPHYFPFTEPSAEFDVWFPEHRDGPRWVEWGGCGMVNPRVLRACGIDPEVHSGFAFGMGVDRTLMLRHGISEIRDLFEGDVRFSRALGAES
ncbi:phenylalanine--tRNA ligase subunit alpha [Plantactinospora sp. KBS50]|uniref:phenylalanine--tRNA ligase subunit alpha n=1 Tax=Plantactinospora sp. KBS50 TaxID=2024580 RepID=UPI000BAAFD64|nr:phenylalanine--tRNA ligase subunit alpha [Plantactinospora sp. KBS50]ASW54705.1 phenylalanine--tRNA ligase subunit alpha [Plantactinospora sp. KBS50]